MFQTQQEETSMNTTAQEKVQPPQHVLNTSSIQDTNHTVLELEKENHNKTSSDTDSQMDEAQSIVQQRMILDNEREQLSRQQQDLDRQHISLRHKYTELHMMCEHPNDKRSRTHGPYPQTEYWCPDCHREDVFG